MKLIAPRYSATLDGDFVLFIVGMRINRLCAIHIWPAILLRALRIIRSATPGANGLLSREIVISGKGIALITYWDDFDQWEEFGNSDNHHRSSWKYFYERVINSKAVGLWHELYSIKQGEYQTIYMQMPPKGLSRSKEARISENPPSKAHDRMNPR